MGSNPTPSSMVDLDYFLYEYNFSGSLFEKVLIVVLKINGPFMSYLIVITLYCMLKQMGRCAEWLKAVDCKSTTLETLEVRILPGSPFEKLFKCFTVLHCSFCNV